MQTHPVSVRAVREEPLSVTSTPATGIPPMAVTLPVTFGATTTSCAPSATGQIVATTNTEARATRWTARANLIREYYRNIRWCFQLQRLVQQPPLSPLRAPCQNDGGRCPWFRLQSRQS